MKRIKLPLYDSPDYFFTVPLEGTLYKIRLYFNERMQWWMIDLRYANNNPLFLGERLSPNYPLFDDYIKDNLSGFFFLSPKGKYKNQTVRNPYKLSKYYSLYYYFD